MKRIDKNIKTSQHIKTKKPYSTPVLTCFGTVGELTAGGSGTRSELNPTSGKCNNSPKKQRC